MLTHLGHPYQCLPCCSDRARLCAVPQRRQQGQRGGSRVPTRPSTAAFASGVTAERKLEFHVGETTISVPMEADRVKQLDTAMTQLLQTFAAKQKAERPRRWDLLEIRFKGDASKQDELEFFELVCNPNAYTTAFEAKMLITMRTRGGLKVATEARLSAVKSDIDTYTAALKGAAN